MAAESLPTDEPQLCAVSFHVSWRPRCHRSRSGFLRPVALRPHLSVSLPFSVASTMCELCLSVMARHRVILTQGKPPGGVAFGSGPVQGVAVEIQRRGRGESRRESFPGNPAVLGRRPLDRWLCVPAFRRVCPCQRLPLYAHRVRCATQWCDGRHGFGEKGDWPHFQIRPIPI